MHLNLNSNNICWCMKSTKSTCVYFALKSLTNSQSYRLMWGHTGTSTCQVVIFVMNPFLQSLILSSASLHTPVGKHVFMCNKRNLLFQGQRLLKLQRKQKLTKHITLFLAASRALGRLWLNSSQHTRVTRPLTVQWRGSPWLGEHTQAKRTILVAFVEKLLLEKPS